MWTGAATETQSEADTPSGDRARLATRRSPCQRGSLGNRFFNTRRHAHNLTHQGIDVGESQWTSTEEFLRKFIQSSGAQAGHLLAVKQAGDKPQPFIHHVTACPVLSRGRSVTYAPGMKCYALSKKDNDREDSLSPDDLHLRSTEAPDRRGGNPGQPRLRRVADEHALERVELYICNRNEQ